MKYIKNFENHSISEYEIKETSFRFRGDDYVAEYIITYRGVSKSFFISSEDGIEHEDDPYGFSGDEIICEKMVRERFNKKVRDYIKNDTRLKKFDRLGIE